MSISIRILGLLLTGFSTCVLARQTADVKFVADTAIVQADGSYELDPDLATLTFDISTQEKDFKQAYAKASQSMRNIVDIAQKNGLAKEDIQTGVLTMAPSYETDRHKRAKSYLVQGQIVLKVRDFSKVGLLVDDAIQDGIADFRSLSYSLANEEAAKEKAVAQAMQRAVGRAKSALEQTRQKLGPVLYLNLDVKHLVSVSQVQLSTYATQTVEVTDGNAGGGFWSHAKTAPPPPPPPPVQPEKVSIGATVQCVFAIEH